MFDLIRSTTFTLATFLASSVIAANAEAQAPRAPLRAAEAPRTTTATFARYDEPVVIERERGDFKTHAVFSAEPQAIEPNAVLLFEITSEGLDGALPRWRCVAVHDVAECLGNGVSIPYGAREDKVVLRITAKPRDAKESQALVAAHQAAKKQALAAREADRRAQDAETSAVRE